MADEREGLREGWAGQDPSEERSCEAGSGLRAERGVGEQESLSDGRGEGLGSDWYLFKAECILTVHSDLTSRLKRAFDLGCGGPNLVRV